MSPDSADFSPGEIQRSLARLEKSVVDLTTEVRARHHELSNSVNVVVGPISILKEKMSMAETTIIRLEVQVDDVTQKAAWVAGLGVGLAFALSLLLHYVWK